MERQVVIFASPELLEKINQLSGFAIPVMPSINNQIDVEYWVKRLRPAAVEIHANLITPDIVKRFHEAGVIIQAQALDERDTPDTWRACMDMGIDWIQTDCGENVISGYTQRLAKDNPPVKISAHRGANEFAPENTLAAYCKAIDLGVDYIEIDVRTTKDKELVSLHDKSLNRTTDGQGPVTEKTLAELKQLSAGVKFSNRYSTERIPTLKQICEFVRLHPGPHGLAGLYVDMKDVDAEALIQILVHFGLTEKNVFYGSEKELLTVRKFLPDARIMPGLGREEQLDAIVETIKPYSLDTRWNLLSKNFLEHACQRGLRIFSDAMGEPETIDSYLHAIDWGIDTIQTDRIPRVFRAMELRIRSRN